MKILITDSWDDVYSSMGGSTRAEQKVSWERAFPAYKVSLTEAMGQWVEVETDHLFEDQFNTKNARFGGLWIIKDIDFAPEFKNKEEYIAAVQKQYNEKWPGIKVNRYFVDYLTKQS